MEKFLLKNMWTIAICFWIIVFITWLIQYINLPVWYFIEYEIKNTITTQYMFTTLWAIFIFWYWYKKYERDKELDIIDKYSTKYNEIINNIEDNKGWVKYKKELVNLFYEEYYLYSKNYISDELWHEWKEWISLDFFKILQWDSEKKIDENGEINFDSLEIIWTYLQANSRINIDWKNFNNFLIWIIKDFINCNNSSIKLIESWNHPLYNRNDNCGKNEKWKWILLYKNNNTYAEILLELSQKLEYHIIIEENNKVRND